MFSGDSAPEGASVDNESMATLFVDYEPGTGGEGVELLCEVQRQGSTAWYPAVSTLSAGTAEDGTQPVELLATTYQAPEARMVNVTLYGYSRLRVRCRELGDTISAAGTCAVTLVASRPGA
mgnify:CR=1 FL=1